MAKDFLVIVRNLVEKVVNNLEVLIILTITCIHL